MIDIVIQMLLQLIDILPYMIPLILIINLVASLLFD